jgi:hypothetical protein
MKRLFCGVLLSVFYSVSAFAANSACPTTVATTYTDSCRQEIAKALLADKVSKTLTADLKSGFKMSACKMTESSSWEVTYNAPGAIGPYLEVSAYVACSGGSYPGLWLNGNYYLDPTDPTFQFKGLTVDFGD